MCKRSPKQYERIKEAVRQRGVIWDKRKVPAEFKAVADDFFAQHMDSKINRLLGSDSPSATSKDERIGWTRGAIHPRFIEAMLYYVSDGWAECGDTFPSWSGLLCACGLSDSQVKQWCAKNDDLDALVSRVKEMLMAQTERQIANGAIIKDFSSDFSKFYLSNKVKGYKDVKHVEAKAEVKGLVGVVDVALQDLLDRTIQIQGDTEQDNTQDSGTSPLDDLVSATAGALPGILPDVQPVKFDLDDDDIDIFPYSSASRATTSHSDRQDDNDVTPVLCGKPDIPPPPPPPTPNLPDDEVPDNDTQAGDQADDSTQQDGKQDDDSVIDDKIWQVDLWSDSADEGDGAVDGVEGQDETDKNGQTHDEAVEGRGVPENLPAPPTPFGTAPHSTPQNPPPYHGNFSGFSSDSDSNNSPSSDKLPGVSEKISEFSSEVGELFRVTRDITDLRSELNEVEAEFLEVFSDVGKE